MMKRKVVTACMCVALLLTSAVPAVAAINPLPATELKTVLPTIITDAYSPTTDTTTYEAATGGFALNVGLSAVLSGTTLTVSGTIPYSTPFGAFDSSTEGNFIYYDYMLPAAGPNKLWIRNQNWGDKSTNANLEYTVSAGTINAAATHRDHLLHIHERVKTEENILVSSSVTAEAIAAPTGGSAPAVIDSVWYPLSSSTWRSWLSSATGTYVAVTIDMRNVTLLDKTEYNRIRAWKTAVSAIKPGGVTIRTM